MKFFIKCAMVVACALLFLKVAVVGEYSAEFIGEIIAVALISLIPLAGLTYGLVCLFSKKQRKQVVDDVFLHLTMFVIWILLLFGEYLGVKSVLEASHKASAKSGTICIMIGLSAYNSEYGVMPPGGNAQIVKALRGDNPKKLVFMDLAPENFNEKGEYLDPWGTPYRAGASNPKSPWAYSCGPDKNDDGGAEGSDDIVSWR